MTNAKHDPIQSASAQPIGWAAFKKGPEGWTQKSQCHPTQGGPQRELQGAMEGLEILPVFAITAPMRLLSPQELAQVDARDPAAVQRKLAEVNGVRLVE